MSTIKTIIALVLFLIPLVININSQDLPNAPKSAISCKGIVSAGGRWCDNGNGTVTDLTTGLVWLKNANYFGLLTWADAKRRIGEELAGGLAGLTDGSPLGAWRLPSLKELIGIAQGNESILSSHPDPFLGVQPSLYWSSTPYDSLYGWDVSLLNGSKGPRLKYGVSSGYVWPVRSAK